MADWVIAVGEALEPVIDQLYHHLRAGPFLIVDNSCVPQRHGADARNAATETTVQVLGEQDKANTSRSYMWCAFGGDPDRPAVVYRYAPGRSTAEAQAIVGSYSGIMQADGYDAYDRLCRDRDDLILAGCWAHTRRKFVDAKNTGKKAGAAQQAISLIARIYRVETELADMARDDEFVSTRKAMVLPVLEELKA